MLFYMEIISLTPKEFCMETGGLVFEIFVSSATIEEIMARGAPDELHGSAQPHNGNVFKLECPFAIWQPTLASRGGDMHLKNRHPRTILADE